MVFVISATVKTSTLEIGELSICGMAKTNAEKYIANATDGVVIGVVDGAWSVTNAGGTSTVPTVSTVTSNVLSGRPGGTERPGLGRLTN